MTRAQYLSTFSVFTRNRLNVSKCDKLMRNQFQKHQQKEVVFRNKCFLSSDLVQLTACNPFYFYASCKVTIKRELQNLQVNSARGQVRCKRQHIHVQQGKMVLATTKGRCCVQLQNIFLTDLLMYPREKCSLSVGSTWKQGDC